MKVLFFCASQVKQGAENMIESFSKGNSKDKKMLVEAQQMLADSKAKIEYLKMRMAKMKQLRTADAASSNNGEQLHKGKYTIVFASFIFIVICVLSSF